MESKVLNEVAIELLTAIRDVEMSHETAPDASALRSIITRLEGQGLLAPSSKSRGVYLLRDSVHGGPELFVSGIGKEIAFASLEFTEACRDNYQILSPHSQRKMQILQVVE